MLLAVVCDVNISFCEFPGADLGGGGVQGVGPPEMTCGFLIQLVKIFVIVVNTYVCRRSVDNKALILSYPNTTGILQKRKKTMWFIGVEVEQETSTPPPKKNPGSAPGFRILSWLMDPN